MDETRARQAGLAAVVAAGASVVLAPLNALARMRTESGRSDFENGAASWWAEPAMRLFEPVLDFASPDTVYLTYGKFYALALFAALACAVAVRNGRPEQPGWSERWGWRITLAAYAGSAVCMLVIYWVAPLGSWMTLLDAGYVVLLVAMLFNVFGHLLLGVALIRSHFRPRLTSWVLVTEPATSIALVSISTQALGMWPMMLAWGVAGWALWRGDRQQKAGAVQGVGSMTR